MVPFCGRISRVEVAVRSEEKILAVAAESRASRAIPGVGNRGFGFRGKIINIHYAEIAFVGIGIGYPFAVGRPIVAVEFPCFGLVHHSYILRVNINILQPQHFIAPHDLLPVGRPGR